MEIIEKAKLGDQECIATILREYNILVKKIVRKFFLVGAELDDLFQEGMIGLFNAINSYDSTRDANFKTFATICVKRSIISAIKKFNSKNSKLLNDRLVLDGEGGLLSERNLEDDDDFVIVLPSHNMLPDDKLIWKEKLEEIKKFVAEKLSTYEKLVLSEFLKGKSYLEISKVVNKDTTSVENALSRIRAKLNPLKNF